MGRKGFVVIFGNNSSLRNCTGFIGERVEEKTPWPLSLEKFGTVGSSETAVKRINHITVYLYIIHLFLNNCNI